MCLCVRMCTYVCVCVCVCMCSCNCFWHACVVEDGQMGLRRVCGRHVRSVGAGTAICTSRLGYLYLRAECKNIDLCTWGHCADTFPPAGVRTYVHVHVHASACVRARGWAGWHVPPCACLCVALTVCLCLYLCVRAKQFICTEIRRAMPCVHACGVLVVDF